MIEFRNVKLNMPGMDVLSDINFTINDKTTTCFVGSKNTGKSSILKLIAGIVKNYSGEILIDGKYIEDSIDTKISMVYEKMERDTNLTVNEYLTFYAKICGMKKSEIEHYINTSLKKYSLMSYKYTDLSFIDSGNLKIISMIRAFISNPKIILFDNFFDLVDTDINDMLIEIIKPLIGKMTLIFASRTLSYIEPVCDNIGVVHNGELLTFGNKEDVYKKAEFNKKIEVLIYEGVTEAIDILKGIKEVSNVAFVDDKIYFNCDGGEAVENMVLKKLIDNDIKVYSYKKENVTFERIFDKIRIG